MSTGIVLCSIVVTNAKTWTLNLFQYIPLTGLVVQCTHDLALETRLTTLTLHLRAVQVESGTFRDKI